MPAPGRKVMFYPQGYYYTCDAKENNIVSECGDWYIPLLRDQIKRGVIDDSTTVIVPNVYFGTLAQLRRLKGF